MIGEGIDRVDGRAKAEGAVAYTGDLVLEGMVHAALVQSPISSGRIAALDTARATSLAGVLAVLNHGNAPRLAPRGAGEMPLLLQDNRINYGGQPIAAVIAETLGAARRAAGVVDARCESLPIVSVLGREAPDLFAPAGVLAEPPDSMRGDPACAWADAEVRLDAIYTAPMQNHHPIGPTWRWPPGRATGSRSTRPCRGYRRRAVRHLRLLDRRPPLTIAHTDRGDTIRIISARPATPSERKIYEKG